MRRSELLEGIREMKFVSVQKRFRAGELSQMEAAELLGISDRTFRRWLERFGDEGAVGLTDRRRGNAAHNRAPETEADSVEVLYRSRYAGWTAKHFHERLVADHGFRWSYTWTKSLLQRRGLQVPARCRGAHRRKRPRRPLPGMMLHQDASKHVWVAGTPACDLVVTLDDATSAIYSAILVDEEGTASTFAGLLETFTTHGLPCSLYTDRGSHYFTTLKAGGRVNRGDPTQVGRALRQLGVAHIAAYSPEARGRSERAFRTLQDRLPKELALAGIATVAAANVYLRETYVPAHNRRFAVAAEQPGSAFMPVSGVDLREVLCHEEERHVGHDNTVVLHKMRLQIPPSPLRAHYVKATVRVRRYADGQYGVFHGPRCIGRYDTEGKLAQEADTKQAA
jgi:transposase